MMILRARARGAREAAMNRRDVRNDAVWAWLQNVPGPAGMERDERCRRRRAALRRHQRESREF
jgi:hypothetical protein